MNLSVYLPSEDRRRVQQKSKGREVSKRNKSSSIWQFEKRFFLAQDFYLEPTGAISRNQIIMPSPQVPSGAKDIHFRNYKAGQNAKDYF